MLISQFRKFNPINIGILALLSLLIGFLFFSSDLKLDIDTAFGPLVKDLFFANAESSSQGVFSLMLIVSLLLIQALFINKVSNFYKLLGKSDFLVALLYITLAFGLIGAAQSTSLLIVNFILILLLFRILKLYHLEKAYFDTFDLGFLIAVGSFIYFPFIVNIFAVWAALFIFRPFNWREWMAPLLGFSAVLILVTVYSFSTDQLHVLENFGLSLLHLDYSKWLVWSPNVLDYSPLIVVSFIFLLFLNTVKNTIFKRIVHVRKSMQFMLILLLLNVLGVFLQSEVSVTHYILTIPVLSVYLGYYFHYAEKKWVYEVLYFLLLASIVYSFTV